MSLTFGTTYLKISAIIFPAYPVFFISNGFFMAIKKSTYSMHLNLIRNVILLIPIIIAAKIFGGVFKRFFGVIVFLIGFT
jgi:Na+-driven multidrug efflux pump